MKKVLFIALIAFIFVSCKEDSSGPSDAVTSNEYFPLSVGSWWEYDVYQIDGNKKAIGSAQGSYRVEVVEKLNYEGRECYKILNSGGANQASYSAIDSEGVWSYDSERGWFLTMSDNITEKEIYNTSREETNSVDGDVFVTKSESSAVMYDNGNGTEDYKGITHEALYLLVISSLKSTITRNGEVMTENTVELENNYTFLKNIGLYSFSVFNENGSPGNYGRKDILTDYSIE